MSETNFVRQMARAVSCVVCLVLLSGCSVTTLRCGVDKDATYVDIVNVPQDLAGSARYYAQLCGFAYQAEPVASLNIIDSARVSR